MTKTRGKKSRSETKRILPPRSSASSSSSSSEEREKERELGLMRDFWTCVFVMMRRCRRNQLDPFLQTVHVTSKVTSLFALFSFSAFDVNVVVEKQESLSVSFVLAGNS